MPKKSLKPTSALLVTPVVLVSCGDEGAKANIITLGWVGVANSDPPMISVAIRPERHSHGIIKRTGEFVVNLVDEAIAAEWRALIDAEKARGGSIVSAGEMYMLWFGSQMFMFVAPSVRVEFCVFACPLMLVAIDRPGVSVSALPNDIGIVPGTRLISA